MRIRRLFLGRAVGRKLTDREDPPSGVGEETAEFFRVSGIESSIPEPLDSPMAINFVLDNWALEVDRPSS